jgi:ribosomal protein S18 acetylase RimI-like enzyme
MEKSEKDYVIQLARDEVNIEAKRLNEYQTYLIYNDRERIGFVSFGFKPDKTIYIYILAFEKHAQRQGFSSIVFDSVMKYGCKKNKRFKGLTAVVHKINEPAIKATKKFGFQVTRKRARYLDLEKAVSSGRGG